MWRKKKTCEKIEIALNLLIWRACFFLFPITCPTFSVWFLGLKEMRFFSIFHFCFFIRFFCFFTHLISSVLLDCLFSFMKNIYGFLYKYFRNIFGGGELPKQQFLCWHLTRCSLIDYEFFDDLFHICQLP